MYTVILIGMPFALTPIQANSLSGLPAELYPHGTAIMNTLQMIAAAPGSSLSIGIMSSRQAALLAVNAIPKKAISKGLVLSFCVGAGIMAAAFLASLCLRGNGRKAQP